MTATETQPTPEADPKPLAVCEECGRPVEHVKCDQCCREELNEQVMPPNDTFAESGE